MLEEKLRQASESSTTQRNRVLLFLLGFLAICVVVIVMVSLFNTETEKVSSRQTLAVNKNQPTVKQSTLAPSGLEQSTVDQSGLRTQFMQRMQAYESKLEPEIAGANLKIWNPEKDVELASQKQATISSFAMGDYADALEKVTQLDVLTRSILSQRQELFDAAMDRAKQGLGADDYTQARLHITKALQLKPGDLQAQAVEKKIEVLPELIRVLKQADVAKVENNPDKEYLYLAEAVNMAPDRVGLKQRRDLLAESIREKQFSLLISRALVSVENNEIAAARLNYKKAAALFPGRSELGILNQAIDKRAAELDLKQLVRQGKKAIAEDDWSRAKSLYLEGSKRHHKDKRVLDGLQLSNRMVSLQQSVASYINQAERLASRNIFAAAQNTVRQADIFASNSKSLTAQSAELKGLLAKMSVKLPVYVKSDNQTYILVRGVGKIGLTSGREIRLKPGLYTFEGSRSGYKSKLVELRLPVGVTSLKVEVICDERI